MTALTGGPVGELTAGEFTLAQLGEQAAEAVRALNHLTRPGSGGRCDPAGVCALVAELAALCGRLPQLLAHLARSLADEQRAGRLRVDALAPQADAAAAVAAVITALAQASEHAHDTGGALDAAQQVLAHLAVAAGTGARRDQR